MCDLVAGLSIHPPRKSRNMEKVDISSVLSIALERLHASLASTQEKTNIFTFLTHISPHPFDIV